MDKKELMNIIGKSDEEDWDYNRDKEIYIFNLNKKITIELDKNYKESFYGLWVNIFEKTDAEKIRFFLCFKREKLGAFYVIKVDSDRMYIPRTDSSNDQISINYIQYNICNILNKKHYTIVNDYEYYLKRAKIYIK